jgi:uroporphyrinogen-III decarboxylase
MISKERVLKTITREKTDRVPFMYRDLPEVRTRLKKHLLAVGGGFFLGPTHNFQDDIPIENILAMYEAGKEWSSFKKLK